MSTTAADLTACLVYKYDWPADSVLLARTQYSAYLDSLRREHEAQVARLMEEQRRQEAMIAEAALRPLARVWGRWVQCILTHRPDTPHRIAVVQTCQQAFPTTGTEQQLLEYLWRRGVSATDQDYLVFASGLAADVH